MLTAAKWAALWRHLASRWRRYAMAAIFLGVSGFLEIQEFRLSQGVMIGPVESFATLLVGQIGLLMIQILAQPLLYGFSQADLVVLVRASIPIQEQLPEPEQDIQEENTSDQGLGGGDTARSREDDAEHQRLTLNRLRESGRLRRAVVNVGITVLSLLSIPLCVYEFGWGWQLGPISMLVAISLFLTRNTLFWNRLLSRSAVTIP